MDKTILLMIVGMAVVTYIPRMIPLVALSQLNLPVFVQNVLRNVPYATLGALIFPGILLISEDIWFGVIGALVAAVVAYFGANVIVVVMSSILALVVYGVLF
ncbi:AzlD domain-containing protein [Metabacillus herbersteinensis]|uniref:AzlD domain-containing protein n=1 Tax=Metabacillus herbersteinensis TaxID=283816 RepID=A0ABV6GLL3_9BACI